jgi:hypothetical protein
MLAPDREKGQPERYPCPRALALHWQLGEYHLIRAGELGEQPAGTWRAQIWASHIWHILEQETEADKDYPLEKRLKQSELKLLIDELRPIRQRLIERG